jgi:cohesin loading factor subunit SCC2
MQLFRPREDKEDSTKKNTEAPPQLVLACQQIVDCLVESVLREEEKSAVDAAKCQDPEQRQQQQQRSSRRVVACLTTLYLFTRIRPQLLVEHAQTLQPYLQVQCKTQADYSIISAVALTLELSVPLIKHPSEIFLSQLEEDAVKLILQHDKKVVAACLSLLGSVVNNVTKNFGLVRDCFVRYYGQMSRYREVHEEYALDPRLIKPATITAFRRAMFTVSLLLRHFDFSKEELYLGLQVRQAALIFEHAVTLTHFVYFYSGRA